MQPRLIEIINELELAYDEHGDVELDGNLLDLALVALMLSVGGDNGD